MESMKMKMVTLVFLLSFTVRLFGQEAEWEPQKRITGFVATEVNYFDNLKFYNRDWGMSVSEVGLLVNYQPLKNITFKSVIVYRPYFSIDQIINEANVEWSKSDAFKVKVGRFLTPLSPMNTYYYAPVNNSVTLPMIISHHEIFPLNMDAVSINGTFGSELKFGYNLFTGGYRSTLWVKTGPVGLFGSEVDYFTKIDNTITYSIDAETYNNTLNFGSGAHIDFSYNEMFTLGFNVFDASDDKMNVFVPSVNPSTGQLIEIPMTFDVEKFAYGANAKFKFNNLMVLGEYWQNDTKFSNDVFQIYQDVAVKGAFVESSYSFGKITPYARYEYHDASIKYERYTAGINYKPIFEATFKLEYLGYVHGSYNLNGIVASAIYSF